MNKTFSLEQRFKTGNLDANLISRQYNIDLTARFMEVKSMIPKLTQREIAEELEYSTSNIHRYRNDINIFSPYRITRNNTNKRKQKIANCEHDLEIPRLTLKQQLKQPKKNPFQIRKRLNLTKTN